MGLHEGEPEDTVECHQECPQHQLYGKSHGLFHGMFPLIRPVQADGHANA